MKDKKPYHSMDADDAVRMAEAFGCEVRRKVRNGGLVVRHPDFPDALRVGTVMPGRVGRAAPHGLVQLLQRLYDRAHPDPTPEPEGTPMDARPLTPPEPEPAAAADAPPVPHANGRAAHEPDPLDGLIVLMDAVRELRPAVADLRRDVHAVQEEAARGARARAETESLRTAVNSLQGKVGAMGETAVVEARKVVRDALASIDAARDAVAREVRPLAGKADGALVAANRAEAAVRNAAAEIAAATEAAEAAARGHREVYKECCQLKERLAALESKATGPAPDPAALEALHRQMTSLSTSVSGLSTTFTARLEAAKKQTGQEINFLGRANREVVLQAYANADRVQALESAPQAGTDREADRLESLDDRLGSIEAAVRRALGDCGPLAELAQRVTALEAAVAAGAAPVRGNRVATEPPPKHESNLADDAWLSLADWCKIEGPHRRVLRDEDDRNTAGRRLTRAYRSVGARPREVNPFRYRVRDLRLYARWLAGAGLIPNPDAWVEFWRQHDGPDGLDADGEGS